MATPDYHDHQLPVQAKAFADDFVARHKSSDKFDLRKLNKQRIAALNFFTHETPFYGALNGTLRSTNRAEAKPFFPWSFGYLGLRGRACNVCGNGTEQMRQIACLTG